MKNVTLAMPKKKKRPNPRIVTNITVNFCFLNRTRTLNDGILQNLKKNGMNLNMLLQLGFLIMSS